jgi:O-antigen ligase
MFGIVLIAFYSLFSTGKACLVARRAVLFATLTSMCLNFYEFFFPGAFSGVPGRSAGLFLNPNTSGTAMTFGMILSRHLVPVRFRLLYELGIGVAVLSTFSRGAILCWTLAFLLGRLANFGDPGQARNLIFLAAGVGLLYWFTPLGTEINHRIDAESGTSGLAYSRLTFSDSDESLYDSRFSVASAAWESFQQHPLFGTGTGTASFQYGEIALGPHNMFLSLMVQFGATGLLLITSLFVILIVNVLHRRLAIEFTLVLALAAFFSHTLLLQWHYALLIALVYNTSRVPGIREATAVASSETTAHSNQKISMALLGSNRGNPPCRNTISVGCSPQFVTENQRSWIQ